MILIWYADLAYFTYVHVIYTFWSWYPLFWLASAPCWRLSQRHCECNVCNYKNNATKSGIFFLTCYFYGMCDSSQPINKGIVGSQKYSWWFYCSYFGYFHWWLLSSVSMVWIKNRCWHGPMWISLIDSFLTSLRLGGRPSKNSHFQLSSNVSNIKDEHKKQPLENDPPLPHSRMWFPQWTNEYNTLITSFSPKVRHRETT